MKVFALLIWQGYSFGYVTSIFVTLPKFQLIHSADPQSRAGSDHCFRTCFSPCVRTNVPSFKNIAKQSWLEKMITTGGTVGPAEGIIDDTCLVGANATRKT